MPSHTGPSSALRLGPAAARNPSGGQHLGGAYSGPDRNEISSTAGAADGPLPHECVYFLGLPEGRLLVVSKTNEWRNEILSEAHSFLEYFIDASTAKWRDGEYESDISDAFEAVGRDPNSIYFSDICKEDASGRFRAVGVASNKKARTQVAKLSLAMTFGLRAGDAGHRPWPPILRALVEQARAAPVLRAPLTARV